MRFLLLAFLVCFCIPVMAQVGEFKLPVVTASTGEIVSLDVTMDVDVTVQGFSMGVAHNGAFLDVLTVAVGSIYDVQPPELVIENLNPVGGTGWTIAVINSLEAPFFELVPGVGISIVTATYTVVTGQTIVAPLFFTDALGSPPVAVVFVNEAMSVIPALQAGQVVINFPVATNFTRGDVNQDGALNLADPIIIVLRIAGQFPKGTCDDAEDVDDNGSVDIADAIFLMMYMFRGSARPPDPFFTCGTDPVLDNLSCEEFTLCP